MRPQLWNSAGEWAIVYNLNYILCAWARSPTQARTCGPASFEHDPQQHLWMTSRDLIHFVTAMCWWEAYLSGKMSSRRG